MIEQIVFLVRWPISLSDMQRINFVYLNQCGFRTHVFILSKLLDETTSEQTPTAIGSDLFMSHYFHSFQDLEKAILESTATSLFIDCVMDFTLSMARILRMVRKHGGRYFALDGGSVPSTNEPALKTFGDFFQWMKRRVARVSRPNFFFDFFSRRFLILLTKYFRFYPCPDKILSVGSEILQVYLKRYNASPEGIIPIPSHDYDLYVNYQKDKISFTSPSEKIGVFLDVAATHHPDFNVAKIKPFSEQEYYPAMTNLFDALEQKTGLRVVIAAHPHSHYERFPHVFGKREILKGKTIELVEKSSLVISHYSTSISFAVLFNKPILVVKTPEMQAHNLYSVAIDQIAQALGLKAVVLHNPPSIDKIFFDYQNWPRNFDNYKHKYIKPPGTDNATLWEIVVREMRKLDSCPLTNEITIPA